MYHVDQLALGDELVRSPLVVMRRKGLKAQMLRVHCSTVSCVALQIERWVGLTGCI